MGTLQMLSRDQLTVQYGGKSVSKLGQQAFTWRSIHFYLEEYTLVLGGVYTCTWRSIHLYLEGYTLLLRGVYTVTIHFYLEGQTHLLGGVYTFTSTIQAQPKPLKFKLKANHTLSCTCLLHYVIFIIDAKARTYINCIRPQIVST